MIAFEFSTQLTNGNQVVVPPTYAGKIPTGSSVRVILMVEGATEQTNGFQAAAEEPEKETSSLEQFVKQLKQTPINPAMIRPGNMARLAERLANPITEADPDFDPIEWQRLWNEHEAKMKAFERAKEEQELKAMADFFAKWQPV